ncbi:MAG: PTS sugar transporter subunit IIC [Clostridiales bacterium]|nr:PTS sugar transporter subunit IIC [Clostridiales bacterium]
MDYNIFQVLLVFLVTFVIAIDQFDFLESLYQPIVTGPIIGLILGDLNTGLVVGGMYQLMTIGNMPVGGAQPPNAVIGGIMATVLAISVKMDATLAIAAAIPFAMLGQYGITLLFTLRSPINALADKAAENADPKTIEKITFLNMLLIGVVFGLIVTLFFIGGATFGQDIVNAIPKWITAGLSAAGGMMRYVGFAVLLKVMMSKDMWGFYFLGFALACILTGIPALAGPALLLLAFIGFGFAYWDYQNRIHMKELAGTAGANYNGGDEDGI